MVFGPPPIPSPTGIRLDLELDPIINPYPAEPRLLSQGEVRPGMVQGQHWAGRDSIPPLGTLRHIARWESADPWAARPEWIDTFPKFGNIVAERYPHMFPSFRPNKRLSHRGYI